MKVVSGLDGDSGKGIVKSNFLCVDERSFNAALFSGLTISVVKI